MTDPDTAAKEYAEVMSVIERVREERSRLDTTIATLEGLAEKTQTGYRQCWFASCAGSAGDAARER